MRLILLARGRLLSKQAPARAQGPDCTQAGSNLCPQANASRPPHHHRNCDLQIQNDARRRLDEFWKAAVFRWGLGFLKSEAAVSAERRRWMELGNAASDLGLGIPRLGWIKESERSTPLRGTTRRGQPLEKGTV